MFFDTIVESVLWGKSRSNYILLESVIDAVASDIKKSISLNRCPFCRRPFKNRRSLKTHLTHSKICSDRYRLSIKYTVDIYMYIRRYVTKTSTSIAIDLPGMPKIRFRSVKELAKWIKPQIRYIASEIQDKF